MHRVTLLLASLLAAWSAGATSVGPVDEERAAARADAVADIEILEAHELKAGTTACGSKYRAKIIARRKGQAGFLGKVDFNSRGGFERGARLRVFLAGDQDGKLLISLLVDSGSSPGDAETRFKACRLLYGSAKRGFTVVRLSSTK